jgi:hypothetical protein
MSRPRNGSAQFKRLAVVPSSGNREPAAVPPAFDGTITSACESAGISLERIIELMRWAKESDPRVARFLDAWDALGASEQEARGAADAVCERVGLAPVELLRVVAGTACRIAKCEAQLLAAVSLPDVVAKTVHTALNAPHPKARLRAAEMLFQATSFLPTPKGSQTIFGTIMQNAQAGANARSVPAPSPEQMIRRMTDRFNRSRGLPRPATPRAEDDGK